MLPIRTAVAVLLALSLAPAAAAQPPAGDFGGGAVRTTAALAAGNMVVGLRSDDGTSVRVVATIVGRCASGTFSATVPVGGDGAFEAVGAVRQARTTMRYALRGTLAERPSGTASARFERTTSRRTRTCSARDVAWEAHRPPLGIGEPARPPAGALLTGPTAQRDPAGAPLGIALRLSADGRRVSRAIYGVRMRCSKVGTSPTFDLPRADVEILPDGRVSDREAGTVKTDSSILKYVERFGATLGSTGATGYFSVELSVRRRATGKRVTRCRSGEVRWSAAI